MGRYLRVASGLCVFMCLTAGISHAADIGPEPSEFDFGSGPEGPVKTWNWEVGARYWFSTGESSYDLLDSTSTILVSRLTYQDLAAHSGETFFRGDHSSGFFVKGNVGAGIVDSGNLIDEDFPPVVSLFSQTTSDQNDGNISYASLDLGYTFYDNTVLSFSYKDEPAASTGMRLGAFIGYHYLNEKFNAFGCTQLAINPFICGGGGIPTNILVISQDTDWSSLRIGLTGDFLLSDRLKLTGDVAYVSTRLDGADTHHLRGDFNAPLPQEGDGYGVQLEAVLSYQLTDAFDIGVGARYWHMEIEDGTLDFTEATGGVFGAQGLNFETERYGVFVQGSYQF